MDPFHTVRTIVADNPGPLTLDGSRTYVVGGDPCVVVDPGPMLGDHLDAVEVAVGAAEVAAVCITHYHPDHAAGAAELVVRFAAPLAATEESARLAQLDAPDLALAPGVRVEFDGGGLDVVAAPGHCPDHVCFYWPELRTLFTGDVILGEGSSMIAPPEGDMGEYMATLERLAALSAELIYPGHGAPIEDAGAVIAEYIEHRRQREAQVISALGAGAGTVVDIRAAVYPDLDPRLHRAAEGSVRAHLAKLIGDGRVRQQGEAFHLTVEGA